ncbi:MCE family protein [Mycobacterium sp. smrl_JER01]|uniref:MCE family protein n=1 Tax=Mycobacterium sp. smrl_JER01 TaxID=3402633 RepID=UPI003AC4E710
MTANRQWIPRVPAGMRAVLIVALVALLVAGTAFVVRQTFFGPKTIVAYFSSATAIYPGDQVRVAGVPVGTIRSIEPQGTRARMTLAIDHDVPIPADAKAVIVAQNLVAARYVQLTPAYGSSEAPGGPTLSDGAEIGQDRTAVPVEWDQIKEQLTRLATDLGPSSAVSTTAVGRFIDTAADAMDGNGARLREAIAQLSGAGRILADGSGDIVDVVKNLQVFVTALRDSNVQIVAFQNRLASLTSVLDGSRADLDAALDNLSVAIGEVRRFVAGSRDQTAEQIQRLGAVTQVLSDDSMALKNVLHAAPNALANGYNIYNPDTGTAMGAFALANLANPVSLVCSAIGALSNVTASETSRICAQYLGPALRLLNFNYLPFPFNSYLAKAPSPENLHYTDPALAPGGVGMPPGAMELPPAVSAYTAIGDQPPPPGWYDPSRPPGAYAPHGLPANPSPALYPGAPVPPGVPPAPAASSALPAPGPTTLPDLLLPAEAPQPGVAP